MNKVILAPHPTSYWLQNEDGITQDLLEKAAEGHDNNNNDKWSFNLGNFRVPVKFDISDNENDTKGILGGAVGNGNNNDDNSDSKNAYDQLAAQLLQPSSISKMVSPLANLLRLQLKMLIPFL